MSEWSENGLLGSRGQPIVDIWPDISIGFKNLLPKPKLIVHLFDNPLKHCAKMQTSQVSISSSLPNDDVLHTCNSIYFDLEIEITVYWNKCNYSRYGCKYHENISSWYDTNPKVDTGQKNNSLFNAVKGRKFAKGGEVEKSGQKMFDWLKSGHTH